MQQYIDVFTLSVWLIFIVPYQVKPLSNKYGNNHSRHIPFLTQALYELTGVALLIATNRLTPT
jgi:hypothetical protein